MGRSAFGGKGVQQKEEEKKED